MLVGKWGDSLAVRLPAAVVELLQLKEGDEIVVEAAGVGIVRVARDQSLDDAFARLDALDWRLPEGFRFSRQEANERGPLAEG